MKKITTIFTLASITTFALFVLMAYMISNDNIVMTKPKPPVIITVFKAPEDSKPEIKKTLPAPPPIPKVKPSVMEDVEVVNTTTGPIIGPIGFEVENNSLSGISLPTRGDSDAQPVVRISPKYPITAVKEGIEGWVKLAFDINSLGEVINVKVLAAQPKRIFDKEAKRALKKWKYKAKYIDGKQVNQQNLTVQLDFNLEQS